MERFVQHGEELLEGGSIHRLIRDDHRHLKKVRLIQKVLRNAVEHVRGAEVLGAVASIPVGRVLEDAVRLRAGRSGHCRRGRDVVPPPHVAGEFLLRDVDRRWKLGPRDEKSKAQVRRQDVNREPRRVASTDQHPMSPGTAQSQHRYSHSHSTITASCTDQHPMSPGTNVEPITRRVWGDTAQRNAGVMVEIKPRSRIPGDGFVGIVPGRGRHERTDRLCDVVLRADLERDVDRVALTHDRLREVLERHRADSGGVELGGAGMQGLVILVAMPMPVRCCTRFTSSGRSWGFTGSGTNGGKQAYSERVRGDRALRHAHLSGAARGAPVRGAD